MSPSRRIGKPFKTFYIISLSTHQEMNINFPIHIAAFHQSQSSWHISGEDARCPANPETPHLNPAIDVNENGMCVTLRACSSSRGVLRVPLGNEDETNEGECSKRQGGRDPGGE